MRRYALELRQTPRQETTQWKRRKPYPYPSSTTSQASMTREWSVPKNTNSETSSRSPSQGNRILLSESEYRSQILQVPARSLALRRHADFQRLLPFHQVQRQTPKRRHVLRRVSDPDHAPVLTERRAGVRLRPFSTPQCSLTAPKILSALAGRLVMKYRL